jgi:hypothetical protein
MTLYAIRKRRGEWTVCSYEEVVLKFENYDEALLTARGAVEVLTSLPRPRLNHCALRGDIPTVIHSPGTTPIASQKRWRRDL